MPTFIFNSIFILLAFTSCCNCFSLKSQVQSLSSQQQQGCGGYTDKELKKLEKVQTSVIFLENLGIYAVSYINFWQTDECQLSFNINSQPANSQGNYRVLENLNIAYPDCWKQGAPFYVWLNAKAAVCSWMVPKMFIANYSGPTTLIQFSGTVDYPSSKITLNPIFPPLSYGKCKHYSPDELAALPKQDARAIYIENKGWYSVTYINFWQSEACQLSFNLKYFKSMNTTGNVQFLESIHETYPNCWDEGAPFYVWLNADAAFCPYMVPTTFISNFTGPPVEVQFAGTVDSSKSTIIVNPKITSQSAWDRFWDDTEHDILKGAEDLAIPIYDPYKFAKDALEGKNPFIKTFFCGNYGSWWYKPADAYLGKRTCAVGVKIGLCVATEGEDCVEEVLGKKGTEMVKNFFLGKEKSKITHSIRAFLAKLAMKFTDIPPCLETLIYNQLKANKITDPTTIICTIANLCMCHQHCNCESGSN